MGQCIFCGAIGKLTREHIWADWLKAVIRKDQPHYTTSRNTVWERGRVTDEGGRRVGGDVRSRRVECVCGSRTYPKGSGNKSCNDGWMGDIQNAVKPIVIPLIEGAEAQLGRSDQELLAAWIAMAVMCSEFGRDDPQTIQQEDRTFLYKRRVPPRENWRIWIGDYERDKWSAQWARHVLTITKEKTRKSAFLVRPPLNTQSTTYTVGRLYVHCISSAVRKPVADFRFAAEDRPFLQRIWPIETPTIAWPPPTMKDADAFRISKAFFEWLRGIGERALDG